MNRFTFYIPIEGAGDNAQEAWEDAMEQLLGAIVRGEYEKPPADIFDVDDQVPAAEILGGSLSAGFGVNEGEEDADV